jgi:hypothetical protein
MSELIRRSEVLETYAHPYRRYVGQVVLGYGVPRVVAFAALFVLAGAIAELVTDRGDDILAFGIAAVALAAASAVWTSARAVQMVRERTAEWRGRGGDLAQARARRPHAGDAEPEAAHDEYAVAVSDAEARSTGAALRDITGQD